MTDLPQHLATRRALIQAEWRAQARARLLEVFAVLVALGLVIHLLGR